MRDNGVSSSLDLKPHADSLFEATVTTRNAGVSSTIDVGENMPDMEQLDLVKVVLDMLGAFVQYHPYTNTVEFVQFADVDTNKSDPKELSVNTNSEATHTYKNSFGQNNYANYTEDDEVTENLGRGNVQVSDTKLPLENDLFTLPFAASKEVTKLFGKKMALCKLFDSSNVRSFSPVPRILLRTNSEVAAVDLQDITGTAFTRVTDAKIAYFDVGSSTSGYGLDFTTLIADEWDGYVSIIQKGRGVNIRGKIMPEDVQDFDFSKPVYLDVRTRKNYINGFFFVERISKYENQDLSPEITLLEI